MKSSRTIFMTLALLCVVKVVLGSPLGGGDEYRQEADENGAKSDNKFFALRGRRSVGLTTDDDLYEDDLGQDDLLTLYKKDQFNHLMRGRRGGSSFDHFVRGRRTFDDNEDYFTRGRKEFDHFMRGRRGDDFHRILRRAGGGVNHFLRGKK